MRAWETVVALHGDGKKPENDDLYKTKVEKNIQYVYFWSDRFKDLKGRTD